MSKAEEMILKTASACGFVCSVVVFGVSIKVAFKLIKKGVLA